MAVLVACGLAATTARASAQTGTASGSAEVSVEDGREEAETRYDPNLDQAARRVFVSASQAFAAGEYEVALERFKQAYSLSPRPTLLYNIAATLDRLRRDAEAVEALKRYLEAVPDADDRTEIEARIRVLEAAEARREEQTATNRVAVEQPTTPEEPEPVVIDPVKPVEEGGGGLHPGITLGVAGAALVVGGLLVWSGTNALSRNDDYTAYVAELGATLVQGEELLADVESAERRTNILMGVTIGVGVAAGVMAVFTNWGAFGSDDDDSVARVNATVGRGGAMLGATGHF